jgi:hypothetical protein
MVTDLGRLPAAIRLTRGDLTSLGIGALTADQLGIRAIDYTGGALLLLAAAALAPLTGARPNRTNADTSQPDGAGLVRLAAAAAAAVPLGLHRLRRHLAALRRRFAQPALATLRLVRHPNLF